MTSWEPAQSDLDWTKDLISKFVEGGVWGIPESFAIFSFYLSKKEYTLTEGEGFEGHETTKRTQKILGILGWKER